MAKTNALTEWLGISPGEQPPHHYRLLSLKLFASDRGKIDAAAENAIDRVRKRAGEKNKAVAGKLIGMINAARACLLNADSKSAYDKKLRDSGGAAPAMGGSLPEPLELEQIIKSDKSNPRKRSRSSSASILLPTVGGAVVALLVYVFAFSGLLDGEKEDGKKPGGQQLANNGKDSTPPSLPAKSKPKSKKPAKSPTVARKSLPPVKIAVKTLPSVKIDRKTPSTANGKKKTGGSPVSVKPVPTPLAKTVDLLKLIDPKKNTLSGTWEFEGNALVGKGGRIEIPHTLPEEYRLKLVVQRVILSDRSIAIGLVGGGRPFDAAIGFSSRGSALNVLDGKEITANETYVKGKFLKPRDPVEIECRVNKAGVIIIVDGRTIIDWKGDFSRLTSIRPHRNPKFLSLTVGSPFRFSKIELSPLGTSKPKPQVIDLLKKIDPQRDAIKGKWALEDGVLSTTGAEPSYIIITNHAPQEYELRL
ncbi:MAG: hypothetical protein IID45_06120, partial [Planctomycetes bacterium]|nr:hypothetical protein [Planctomycetota bacterium]